MGIHPIPKGFIFDYENGRIPEAMLSYKIIFTKLQQYKCSVSLHLHEKSTRSINRPLFQISMQLLSKQIFINIIIRFLEHMATCLDQHLNHLQANIFQKIQFHAELTYW